MSEKHDFHKLIGTLIERTCNEIPNTSIIKSPECGGTHGLSLYCKEGVKNETKFCEVDLLILLNNKVKIIIEIEESKYNPVHIFGKYLASASSNFYTYEPVDNGEKYFLEDVTFIQILDTTESPGGTRKFEQWKNIEMSINGVLSKIGKIKKYKIFAGNQLEFNNLDAEVNILFTEYLVNDLRC